MAAIRWPRVRKLPPGCSAVLDALSLDRPRRDGLRRLSAHDWQEALAFLDASRMTLIFSGVCRSSLPEWVAERTRANREANRRKLRMLADEYREIARAFAGTGVKHCLLKGFSQAEDFLADPWLRVQYDLDILCARKDLAAAADTLRRLGFEQAGGGRQELADHLAPFVRKTGWRWRGDYFDPAMPPIVELHYRLWDARTERIPVEGLEEFWRRRRTGRFLEVDAPALHRTDRLGYAALHLLRHVLRGGLAAAHVYELACFLNRRASDEWFWRRWAALHAEPFRRLQAVSFRLAHCWFGGRVPPAVEELWERQPAAVQEWFRHYAASPMTSRFASNKDELWLHLALLGSWQDRRAVARRRLLPVALPGAVEDIYVPAGQSGPRLRAAKALRYAAFVVRRSWFHAASLARVVPGAALWWWRLRRAGAARLSRSSRARCRAST